MNDETKNLLKICMDALYAAHQTLESLGEDGTEEVHDERVVDITTRGDRAVTQNLIDFFRKSNIPAVLYTEESGRVLIQILQIPKHTQ